MQITRTLYVVKRSEWREWLEKNFQNEPEIWLVFPKKSSKKPRISYNDAVEEALCFGWIDSIVKSLDEQSSAQRFSPRKSNSNFSQTNIERLRWLLKNGLVHSSLIGFAEQKTSKKFVFPQDIIRALKEDKTVWSNYQRYSDPYKRIRIAYIDQARDRPEEFKKRLSNFIKKTKANKRIGYGGIEKYFSMVLIILISVLFS